MKQKVEQLKTYVCLIKSSCEAPDWEREVEARSLEEAAKKFAKMASGCLSNEHDTYCEDWYWEDILPYVEELN